MKLLLNSLLRLLVGMELIVAVTASARAADPPEREVQSEIESRTGKQTEWIRTQEQRERVQEVVSKLLKRPLTAESAAQIALLNNQDLPATLAEIEISQADLVEAGLLANPSFDGMARFPSGPAAASNLEGALAQDFLDILILPLRKRVAAAELEATKLHVASEVLTLVEETKAALYAVQAGSQLQDRIALIIATNEATVQLAQRRHDAGNIADLELAEEQATYNQSRLELAKIALHIAEDREKLNRLLGVFGKQTDWEASRGLPPLPKAETPWSGLESLAVAQRYDLAAAQTQLGIVLTSLKLSRTYRYLGVVELGVSSERDTDRQVVTGPTVKLSLPIFNRGQARIARLSAQLEQAESAFAAMAIKIRSEVREANARVHGQREVTEFHRDTLLPGRIKVLDLTQQQYNAMQVGPANLLLARQNELEAERGYVEAWRDYWIARAMLERAVGGSLDLRRSKSETSTFKQTTH